MRYFFIKRKSDIRFMHNHNKILWADRPVATKHYSKFTIRYI
jgi:hypothetical protein